MTRYLSRIAAAAFGGYAFTWGFTTLGIAGLVALGVEYHDAEAGTLILAFLVFLGMFLWAFAAASLVRVWVVMAVGTIVMIGAGLALQQALIG
jgi:hypothetical protein